MLTVIQPFTYFIIYKRLFSIPTELNFKFYFVNMWLDAFNIFVLSFLIFQTEFNVAQALVPPMNKCTYIYIYIRGRPYKTVGERYLIIQTIINNVIGLCY